MPVDGSVIQPQSVFDIFERGAIAHGEVCDILAELHNHACPVDAADRAEVADGVDIWRDLAFSAKCPIGKKEAYTCSPWDFELLQVP